METIIGNVNNSKTDVVYTNSSPISYSNYALKEKNELENKLSHYQNNSSINLKMGLREKEAEIDKIKASLQELERDQGSYLEKRADEKMQGANRRLQAAESAARNAGEMAERAENTARQAEIAAQNAENAIQRAEQQQRFNNIWGIR